MNNLVLLFWRQYKLLEKDMLVLSEYVSIDKKNYPIFSDRLLKLYLNICSEVDSVADELCKAFGATPKERYGISNKIDIILENCDNLKHWRCSTQYEIKTINIEPFHEFIDKDKAEWWKSYNKVKHFRNDKDENGIYNYELANLKNTIYALSALYLLIIKLNEQNQETSLTGIHSELFNIELI